MDLRINNGTPEWSARGADTWSPFSGGKLLISETGVMVDYVTVTVPEGVTSGILVVSCGAGSNMRNAYPEITGDGITSSNELYKNTATLANGVVSSIKVLKCVFTPGGAIKTGWNNAANDANIVHTFMIG